MKNLRTTRKVLSWLTSSAVALAVTGVAVTAFAAATSKRNVNAVEYSENLLLIQLDDSNNYYGNASLGGSCSAYDINGTTLKAWTSMSQAALLSGKKLKIYYQTCGGTKYITHLDLWVN